MMTCAECRQANVAFIRDKQVSPVDVTKAVLDRIDQLNPRLNAYCTSMTIGSIGKMA